MPDEATQAHEPKIGLPEALLVGFFFFILDLLDSFLIVGPTFSLVVSEFYVYLKGINGSFILGANVLKFFLGPLPARTVAFGITVWLEHHPKLERAAALAVAVAETVATSGAAAPAAAGAAGGAATGAAGVGVAGEAAAGSTVGGVSAELGVMESAPETAIRAGAGAEGGAMESVGKPMEEVRQEERAQRRLARERPQSPGEKEERDEEKTRETTPDIADYFSSQEKERGEEGEEPPLADGDRPSPLMDTGGEKDRGVELGDNNEVRLPKAA